MGESITLLINFSLSAFYFTEPSNLCSKMANAGRSMNQIFARLIWAERILFYLNPAQIPFDIPSEEEPDNDGLDDEEEPNFLDID